MSGNAPQIPRLDLLLDNALPQLTFAAERGLLTRPQTHELHAFVETVRRAPAYRKAFLHPMSLSRILWGDVSHLQSFFSRLPNEIMVEIICLLSVEDILSLRTTCKRLCSLTRLRCVWDSALHRQVVHAGLPVPSPRSICGPRYRFASPLNLELRAVHATRLHANFTSDNPQIARAVQLHTSSPLRRRLHLDDEPLPSSLTSVTCIRFVESSHGIHYLVASFAMDCLGCWEFSPDSGNIFHVAQWHSVHGLISDIVVNEHPFDPKRNSSQGMIAVSCEVDLGVRIMLLALDKFRGVFVVIGSIMNPNSCYLHTFMGDLLAFSEETRVIHWRDKFSCTLSDQSPATTGSSALSMRFIEPNFVMVVTYRAASLFQIPKVQALTHMVTHPIASFDLPFAPYEVALSWYHPQAHSAPMSAKEQHRRHPISLLMLSKGNTLHHYVFALQPSQADGSFPLCPVQFPPTLIRSMIVSRSCTDLYLSPSGRGYWLETRNVGSKRRSYPARCIIPLSITCTSAQELSPSLPEQAYWVKLKVGARPLYERQCGWKDLKDGKQSISAVALEDSLGRIAVGDVDGGIVVLDYA